jgi:hypothetical protein
MLRIFIALKNSSSSVGFETATLGSNGKYESIYVKFQVDIGGDHIDNQ